ncbi:DUF1871 family protein [Alicyclobacillus fastidiosus]|uniref:DUF1871 family protein n=1 Tax=Alicyclobacillus fastidiosus TaxID=392011 RepID=A0ABV5ALY3_9BACL|nr:DUF1871 family protein [Alicyclobacillus fastidiosus]WEH09027.1 DUF1871 family protein [Alicyclobacillus fastidiosus]
MDDEQKRKYIRRFDIVQGVVNKWDPIGLFPSDAAPFDEYEPEIAHIVALLDKNEHDVLETAKGIFKVFSDWFGDDYAHYFPLEDCKRVAIRIWQAINGESIRD